MLKGITVDKTIHLRYCDSMLVNFTVHEKAWELQVGQWEYFVWRLLMSKAAVEVVYFPYQTNVSHYRKFHLNKCK